MAAIDVGNEAINRAAGFGANLTLIDLANPANDTGIITSMEVWAEANISGFIVGIFFLVSGTTYQCRDSASIGNVAAGSKQTSAVSLAVQAGDYIGCYLGGGTIERDTAGYSGCMYKVGSYITPGDQAVYTLVADDGMSLKGIGSTLALAKRGWWSK